MNRPIGIIDSGVGGLTVAYEIMRQLPGEDFIYLGDTLRCPYGSRNEEEIFEYTLEMVHFLLSKDIKMLIIACNTATAYSLNYLQKHLEIPVIGVIQPGARTAIKMTENNKIVILGTEATIKSKAYVHALKNIHPSVEILNLACPLFVPIIEQGTLNGMEVKSVVGKTLLPLAKENFDTIILGCTHYPLIKEVIQEKVGSNVKIISSGKETAKEASAILELSKLYNQDESHPLFQFYTTGNSKTFSKLAKRLFQKSIKGVQSIKIEIVKI